MDTSKMLDQMLGSARDLLTKGKDLAEQKLNLPASGNERDARLTGMRQGAAAAGLLAVLLGTRAGRRLTGAVVKLGSLAAIGTVAYKAYQQWATQQPGVSAQSLPSPQGQLSGPAAEQHSRSLLRALISAAKADGHIDEQEQATIDAELAKLQLDTDTLHFVKAEIDRPLNVTEVAAGATSQESALEIYATSLLVIDRANDQERTYLGALASALKLPPSLVAVLEKQAAA